MRFKNSDLLFSILVVVVNVAWTQAPGRWMLLGIILALPLILFLPGYALTQTLFRRRALEPEASSGNARQADLKVGHPIGRSDQLVLSIGLSMAVDVLVGFVLNILPIGLNALSWILSLGLITTFFAVWAAFLRRKDVLKATVQPRVRVTLQDGLLVVLATLVVASALWLAVIRPLQPQPSFTQFWMLPANQGSKMCEVSLGVQNFETGSETYRIVVAVNNVQAKVWSAVALDPQQKWVQDIPIQAGTNASNSLNIDANLYKTGNPTVVYRNVHLTFYLSTIDTNGVVQQQCVLGTQS